MLDNISGGRVILGIRRGAAKVEFDGFRLDMGESRERCVEAAQAVLARWRTGRWRSPKNITTNPRRASGPNLSRALGIAHMQPRSHPNLPPIMAELGIGILIIP